jgi:topoisomerase-4 subunit A
MPGNQMIKTARVVGDTLGRFHPHGEDSLVGAITTEVISPVNAITGVGNWGSLIDSAGSPRYTNVLMSAYGKSFFHPNYLPLADKVPSYDYKDSEPLTLPALLPNLLLNGAEGIGLGITTCIPAFTPQSLLPVLADMALGTEFTSLELAKHLEFFHGYGGIVEKGKDNLARIVELFDNPSGSVTWTSPMEVLRDSKQIILRNFAPGVNPIKLVDEVLKPLKEVASVRSGSGVSYVIQVRRDVNFNEFDAFALKVKRLVTASKSYHGTITARTALPDGEYSVKFAKIPIPRIMKMWVNYRVKLEVKSLTWRIAKTEKEKAYTELLVRASDSLDIIFKALRQNDPRAVIVAKMGITEEEADSILNLKVRQLSKLDQDALKEKIAVLVEEIKSLKQELKIPHEKVADFLNRCAATFRPSTNDCSKQWELSSKKL